MDRRQFLRSLVGAAVTVAAGVELLRAPAVDGLKLEPFVYPHWTDTNDWFLAPADNLGTAEFTADTLEYARALMVREPPRRAVPVVVGEDVAEMLRAEVDRA